MDYDIVDGNFVINYFDVIDENNFYEPIVFIMFGLLVQVIEIRLI